MLRTSWLVETSTASTSAASAATALPPVTPYGNPILATACQTPVRQLSANCQTPVKQQRCCRLQLPRPSLLSHHTPTQSYHTLVRHLSGSCQTCTATAFKRHSPFSCDTKNPNLDLPYTKLGKEYSGWTAVHNLARHLSDASTAIAFDRHGPLFPDTMRQPNRTTWQASLTIQRCGLCNHLLSHHTKMPF